MKKKIIVALIACAALSLSACGEKTDIAETTEETTASQPTKTEAEDTSADDEFYTTDLDLTVEGEPEVAFSVTAERRAPCRRHAAFLQQPVAELVAA